MVGKDLDPYILLWQWLSCERLAATTSCRYRVSDR